MLKNKKGFTLVELIVVMAVFIVVIIITGQAFETILKQTSKLFRSEESNIEGVVGLEILRHDLQQAGYGLFTEPLCSSNAYTGEAAALPASAYNEITRSVLDPCLVPPSTASVAALRLPPRAVVAGNNLAVVADSTSETGNTYNVISGSDYLVLRGLTLGRSKTSQKWTHLNFASSSVTPNSWVSKSENFESGDKVLLMRRKITPFVNSLTIEPEPTNGWFYIPFSNAAFSKYSTNYNNYVVYGLDDAATPRMPFNRSDYFVARPAATNAMPAICAPNIGNLYKATVNQADGKLTYTPILDCVADMQVVFGWDLKIVTPTSTTDGQDGVIDTWSSPDPNFRSGSASLTDLQAAMADPELLRSSLKIIKVYILAQDGRRDAGYTSPSPIVVGDTGETFLTKSYDIAAAGLQNYRWKVYRIVIRPKNLASNQ